MMREQGIAANATPRITRGWSKGTTKDPIYQAQRRGASSALRDQVASVAKELMKTATVHDPHRKKLVEMRKAVVDNWMQAAHVLDRQGENRLAGDVRYFVKRLPPVLTDRERIAAGLLRELDHREVEPAASPKDRTRDRWLVR